MGSLPLDEQKLWLPNQLVHDPDTWTTPHLFHLKREYVTLVDKYGCVVQETFTVQDPPASPSDTLLLSPLKYHYTGNERIQERPQTGGFSSGHTTIESHTIETDHEKVGTLDNEHWKV